MPMEYLADGGTISTRETERTEDNAAGMVEETLPMDYSIKARYGTEGGIKICLEQTKESGNETRMERRSADINKDKVDESVETVSNDKHDVAHIHKKEEARYFMKYICDIFTTKCICSADQY